MPSVDSLYLCFHQIMQVGAVDYFLSVTDSGWRTGSVPETEQARRDLLHRFKEELRADNVRHAPAMRDSVASHASMHTVQES